MSAQVIPGSAAGRPQFQTYAHKPARILLASRYSGSNSGYNGYQGGLLYLQWTVNSTASDGLILKVRNYADTALPTQTPSQGDFSFNYNNIVSVQVQVYTGDITVSANQAPGALVYVDKVSGLINVYLFTYDGASIVPYTLLAGDSIHAEVLIQSNTLGGTFA